MSIEKLSLDNTLYRRSALFTNTCSSAKGTANVDDFIACFNYLWGIRSNDYAFPSNDDQHQISNEKFSNKGLIKFEAVVVGRYRRRVGGEEKGWKFSIQYVVIRDI